MKVVISNKVQKQIDRLPEHLSHKLQIWIDTVALAGLHAVQAQPKWEDHALKGDRAGQRSAKLNKGYRIVYEQASGEIVEIMEVGKEPYRH